MRRGALLLFALAGPPPLTAQEGPTPAVFRRYADRVVKVQVVEGRSAAKAVIASAFFADPAGLLVTNFHVVAKQVHDPDRYRVEVVDRDGGVHGASVVGVDAVHDLAILRTEMRPPGSGVFRLGGGRGSRVAQGRRLYSLGHPRDLGLAIVEGTYNGLLRHTLYPRIHFTGAINPGMSGGPTITADGEVVGVNVATAGNEVSFLVPVDDAAALLAEVRRHEEPVTEALADVGRQLRDYQDRYVGPLFADSVPTVVLGHFRVPTQPAPFFNCWGDVQEEEDEPFEVIQHDCDTDDVVYLGPDHWTGFFRLAHRVVSGEHMGRMRFAAVLTDQFRGSGVFTWADEEDVTSYECRTRNLALPPLKVRAVLCLRAYRKFEGLYDATLRAVTVGSGREGLVSTLFLSGVSYQNARALVERYLGGIAWVQ